MSYIKPVILNVDDDAGARRAKTRILRLAGYEVREAGCGCDALAQVQRYLPDLVLLDVKLPDIDGLEVCRRIKEDDASASVLVLQTSASQNGSTDKVRALDGGADNYLVAPVEPDELVANVKALLRLGRVQGELRDSEERFRQMAENIADVFWIFSPHEPTLLYVSPAYETVWGRSCYELDNHFMSWLDSVHPADRRRVRTAFARLAQDQLYEQEFRVVRPDGSIRWIRDRVFPVRNESGVFYRAARISQDISPRKDAEQLLHQADHRKDEFLATLAHELRNPLGPMRSAVELLRMTEGDDTPELQVDAREILGRQIDHLVRLVDDLLDVARISQGKLTLKREFVELKAFVAAALETAQPFLESRRHALKLQLPEGEVWVYGDAMRLSQMISNLLHNAGKYTDRGGEVALRARVRGRRLHIAVEDNGIGISAQQLQRIFDLFMQAERCPDRAPEGLGVGLSLVKKLVELHGGRIDAFSAGPGRGSRFTLELPIEPGRPAPAAHAAPREHAPGELRILLVDDSIDAIKMLKLLLQTLGYEIETAHDGPAALKAALSFRPHVVLLDIGLPGMDGYEVARALRRVPELNRTLLVALTGYGQERDRERARAAGFAHHLIKPLNLEELRGVLDAFADDMARTP